MEDETFERIPWEHLSGSKPPGPPLPLRTLAYLAAGAIAVAGLTATLVSRGDALPPTTSALPIPPSTAVVVTTTSLLSETALQAVPDVGDEAAAWAEWMTEKYFTVDGSGASDLGGLLPPNASLPAPAPNQRVFVESARTLGVQAEGADYRATVIARLLGATDGVAYQRLPDRALVWTLRWQPEGWVVVDLPEEVTPPRLRSGPAQVQEQVPEPVLSAASQVGTVVGGGMVGDLWRVVVTVADSLGGSWPIVAWFSPDGSRVTSTG